MLEQFSLEALKDIAEKAYANFPDNFILCSTVNNDLAKEYTEKVQDENFLISYNVGATGSNYISLTYYMDNRLALYGWFDVHKMDAELEFEIVEDYSPLYMDIPDIGDNNMRHGINKTLLECFRPYADYFRQQLKEETIVPHVDIYQSDIESIMDKLFDAYKQFPTNPDGTLIPRFSERSGDIHAILEHSYPRNDHSGFNLWITYKTDRYVFDLYECGYNFKVGDFTYSKGPKPPGFDKGLNKFKLLGALMN